MQALLLQSAQPQFCSFGHAGQTHNHSKSFQTLDKDTVTLRFKGLSTPDLNAPTKVSALNVNGTDLIIFNSRLLRPYLDSGRIKYAFTGKPINLALMHMTTSKTWEKRRAICRALGMNADQLIAPRLRHSSEIWNASSLKPGDETLEDPDAVIISKSNIPVLFRSGDCLPIVLYSPQKHIAAMVHSGYQGTIEEILPKTIEKLEHEYKVEPSDLIVVMGPSIRMAHYEVNAEIADALAETLPGDILPKDCADYYEKEGEAKAKVDLPEINRLQAESLGVKPENIEIMTIDSGDPVNAPFLWSHRRERQIQVEQQGRHGVFFQLC